MRNGKCVSLALLILMAVMAESSLAAISGITRVGSGLSAPTYATYAPGDPNHLFVLEKGGTIKVVDLNTKSVLATPFLTIPGTDAENEGGLLGLAFHPDYANVGTAGFGKFYVYVTIDNGSVQIPAGTAA